MFSHKCDCDYHLWQDSYEHEMLFLVVISKRLELVGHIFNSQRNKKITKYIDSSF